MRSVRWLKRQPSRRWSSTTTTRGGHLPEKADAVVIGGGSVGCSVAYHLAAKGMRTVLLEAHQLTAGTTWHTAGMLWRLRPSYVDVELHETTRKRCGELERALEVLEGESEGSRRGTVYQANGGLFVATNEERLKEYQRLCDVSSYYGIGASMLTPAEILDVHPLLNVEDLVGAMYSPGDGTIDASNVCDAYKRVAKAEYGAVFSENSRVTNINTADSRIRSVQVESGHVIETDVVVNCGGAWANAVQATCDVSVPAMPLLAMKHAYVVTEQMQELTSLKNRTLPNVRDHDYSIYIKPQGDALCLGGYEQNPEFVETDPNFAFGLYDLDWDTFAQNMDGHFIRCPSIQDAGIKSTVCGPESFTPDHKPLAGPSPYIKGMWLCCGFNSMGMMLAGGVGAELADWITEGYTKQDMFSYDPRRFHADCTSNPKWVKHTTHESYAKTYAVVFPHDEPLADRGQRKSAVYDQLLKAGCVFQARHGFERPGWFLNDGTVREPSKYDFYGAYSEPDSAWRLLGETYPDSVPKNESDPYLEQIEGELTFSWGAAFTTVAKECELARTQAVVFDQSYFGKFLVAGKDAEAFVANVAAAGVPKLHRTAYTPLCNEGGGVEADLTVTRVKDDAFYFVSGGATASKDLAWLRDHSRGMDLTLRDASAEYTVLSVQGPLSRRMVASVLDSEHPKIGPVDFDESVKIMPFSSALLEVPIAGFPCTILRLTFVGELGFELHVPSKGADLVLTKLRNAGCALAGYRAMDSLSAEKGYRHWHADLSNAETPFEAAIGFTVNKRLTKTDDAFIGSDALRSVLKEGPYRRKRLVCLVVPTDDLPAYTPDKPRFGSALHGSETIWRNGRCLGFVRSTAFSHALRAAVSYGYVHTRHPFTDYPIAGVDHLDDDYLLDGIWHIGDKGARFPATLHLKAPFDPTNHKVKTISN